MVGGGRLVIIPGINDGTKLDGDVVAGKTLGIKIHSAGFSVLSSEIENSSKEKKIEKKKKKIQLNFNCPYKLTQHNGNLKVRQIEMHEKYVFILQMVLLQGAKMRRSE